MVITLDALHAQREAARLITEDHGGHHLMFLKANKPTSIELSSTREDSDEQARAAVAHPEVASLPEGLAETLAGAPELLRTRGPGTPGPPKPETPTPSEGHAEPGAATAHSGIRASW